MGRNRARADDERFADLGVGQSVGGQGEDLEFPTAQRSDVDGVEADDRGQRLIPLAGYNILVNNLDKVIFKMENTAVQFMDLLQEPSR